MNQLILALAYCECVKLKKETKNSNWLTVNMTLHSAYGHWTVTVIFQQCFTVILVLFLDFAKKDHILETRLHLRISVKPRIITVYNNYNKNLILQLNLIGIVAADFRFVQWKKYRDYIKGDHYATLLCKHLDIVPYNTIQ
ncbi:hypothetical protein V1478_006205 [Vespula squamosa]|uniref:Uncharacterized protein n=1 Tax=Vespula squamosa TaxID=30214 RepID=A0ABD2B785_VESSQ